jgi:hypothetical protein
MCENSGEFTETSTQPIRKFNVQSLNLPHELQKDFFKTDLITARQGPPSVALQQLRSAFAAHASPH